MDSNAVVLVYQYCYLRKYSGSNKSTNIQLEGQTSQGMWDYFFWAQEDTLDRMVDQKVRVAVNCWSLRCHKLWAKTLLVATICSVVNSFVSNHAHRQNLLVDWGEWSATLRGYRDLQASPWRVVRLQWRVSTCKIPFYFVQRNWTMSARERNCGEFLIESVGCIQSYWFWICGAHFLKTF